MSIFQKRRILIIGAPKSGTTALYYRLLQALGFFTKGYFEPRNLQTIGVPPIYYKNLLVKAVLLEDIDSAVLRAFNKIILLVRDPRDVLISSLIYEASYHATWDLDPEVIQEYTRKLRKKEQQPGSISSVSLWNEMVSGSLAIDQFFQRISFLDRAVQKTDGYILKYEDFIQNNLSELERYLGLSLNRSGKIAVEHNRVIRTKSAGNWRDWFNEEDVRLLKEMMNPFLQKFGYDDADWVIRNQSIPADTCSEYYLRLVNERRVKKGLSRISTDTSPRNTGN